MMGMAIYDINVPLLKNNNAVLAFSAETIKIKVTAAGNTNYKSVSKTITCKVIVPSAEEVERNPRSRSAKLRVAELIARPTNDKI